MFSKRVLTVSFLTVLGLSSAAQGQKATAATQAPAATCPTSERTALPLSCWPGQKVRILATEYDTYIYLAKTAEEAASSEGKLKSKSYAGRTGTIKRLVSVSRQEYVGEIVMDDNKEVIYAQIDGVRMPNIAFVKDFLLAKKAILGKDFWIKRNSLALFGKKDAEGYPVWIDLPRFTKVTVADVGYSDDYNAPIMVVVKVPDGRLAYRLVSWGQTNVLNTPFGTEKFEMSFLDKNPKETFHFAENQWNAIYKNQVIVGMDKQATILAWNREPDEISNYAGQAGNHTISGVAFDEQWTYWEIKNKHVYFKDGKVVYIDQ